MLPPTRRRFLATTAAAIAWAGTRVEAAPGELSVRDLTIDGDADLARRYTLHVPRGLAPDQKLPLVVLLHGLGETGDPRAGAYAWPERYGLTTSYARLVSPPIERTSKRPDWSDARLAEVNLALQKRPFRGLVLACPVTPNVQKARDPGAALDRYADWIADVLVPHARKLAPVIADAAHTHLDGCSLGGYVGLEVFIRRPDAFGAWGGVQSAFGPQRAPAYADRLAKVVQKAPRPLHLVSSQGDPFRDANVALAKQLEARSVPHELRVLPGPHDQPWLREAGTIEMLLWHDRI